MKWETQKKLHEEMVKKEADLLIRKGAEYASDADSLANFKKRGAEFGIDPLKVLGIFMSKHLDSIRSYIEKGHVISDEPIEGRIQDARNYLFLMHCLVIEMRQLEKEKKNELVEFATVMDSGKS